MRDLLAETRAQGGLAPVDLERFWHDQALADLDPFGPDIPQVPLRFWWWGECIWDEMGLPEDMWRYEHDPEWRVALNKAFNDKAQRIVGKRLLNETPWDGTAHYPSVRPIHEVFEARAVWQTGSWWITESARTPDELARLLDRVDRRDVRAFILPDDWDVHRQRLMARGIRPPLYRQQRGPVTLATSLFGVENLCLLILDQPDLAARFRDTILRVMLDIGRVLDEEAGYTPETAPRGFRFNDDNCYLLTPDMYAFFGYPILKGVFERYAPDPADRRYQHSDSAMGHLLPVLASLNLSAVNFGPTLTVGEIRRAMPQTVIEGQLDPMVFCRNEEAEIVAQCLRDFEQARDTRGLGLNTAGVVNDGTRLTSLRLVMATVQRHGRYDT